MAYKVEITDSAKAELDEIVRYLVEELSNPISAKKLLDDFYEQKSYLYDNPYIFPVCSIQSLQQKGYRRFLFMKNWFKNTKQSFATKPGKPCTGDYL